MIIDEEHPPIRFPTALLITALLLLYAGQVSAQEPSFGDGLWTVRDGLTYGARPDDTGPIGGGAGYREAVVTGDYVVSSIDEFLGAVARASEGETIFIAGDTVLDFTRRTANGGFTIRVPAGVTIASDRGSGGSPGALIRSLTLRTPPLIEALGSGVRITGLRIEGPDKGQRQSHYDEAFRGLTLSEREARVGHAFYYLLPASVGIATSFDGLEVDNCELFGWSHAAVYLRDGAGHSIHHSYIHHNQRQGLGYGIVHDTAFSNIDFNLFNYNRHSIAGTGAHPSGYEARNNIEMGESLSHAFDMHGGRDRNDGTDIAGTRIVIENNTFLTPARAIGIRGTPLEYAYISRNWFYLPRLGSRTIIRWPLRDTVTVVDNAYDARSTGAPQ